MNDNKHAPRLILPRAERQLGPAAQAAAEVTREMVNARYKIEALESALRDTQQMLYTVIYAQPENTVRLPESAFVGLPDRSWMQQSADVEGTVTLTVKEIDNGQ